MIRVTNPAYSHSVKCGLILPRWAEAVNPDPQVAVCPLPIAYPVMNSDGTINKIIIVHGGGKYATAPTATVTKLSTQGTNFTLNVKIDSDGYVTSLTPTPTGKTYVYDVPPHIVFSSGTMVSTAYVREDMQYTVGNGAGTGYRILLLRRGVKKLMVQSNAGTNGVNICFFSSNLWTPNKPFSGASGFGNTGITQYLGDTGGILAVQAANIPFSHKEIPVPQGIFEDADGKQCDGFVAIRIVTAGEVRVQEVF